MGYLVEHGGAPTVRRPVVPSAGQGRHFIVRWDDDAKRYVCDCGHRSITATEHEIHAKADQTEAANDAYWRARREGTL